jgi:hypothetical protein
MGNQQAQTDPSKPTQGIDSLSEIANATGTDKTKINKGFSNVIQNYKKKENTITKKYKITRKQIIDSFNKYAINNDYLNKPLFNDAICSLFSFPDIPEIHYTFLSLRLYTLIDDSGDGKIQLDEFVENLEKVLMNKDFKLLLCLMVMKINSSQSNQFITADEIKEYFYQSWIEGYKHLGWQVNKNKFQFEGDGNKVPTVKQFETWSSKFRQQIYKSIEMDLAESGIDFTKEITFPMFCQWVQKDHTLYLGYSGKNVKIATDLMKLELIEYDNSMEGNEIRQSGFVGNMGN